MSKLPGQAWCWSFLLCASNALGAEVPAAPGGPRSASVVVVLDASSSMLGAMGKSTKMKVARQVTHDLVKDWDPQLSVGLTAYGHRQAKSCEDIEAVVPLGPLDRKAFNAAIDRLKPKGKTPLASAIRNAAQQLGYAHSKATVIVITDGIENCGGDPCAVAAELKQKGIDFTAHVVGLGAISAQESKQLACIAEKTGGQYRGAKDAPALKAALGGLVQQVEEKGGLRPPTVGTAGATLRELPEQTSGNLKIVAVRTPGGVPIKSVWRIRNEDGSDVLASVDQTTSATFGLAPGKYRLVAEASNAEDGNVKVDLHFEVGTGKQHVLELAYNSGKASFTSFEFENGPPVPSIFRIQRPGSTDRAGSADYRTKPDFELFAGTYEVRVELGNAKVTRAFEVTPGGETSTNIALNIGRLTLRAVATPGGEALKDCHWSLFAAQPDGSLGERAGGEDYMRNPEFILAAGEYVARVQIDGGRKGELRVSVKPGSKLSEEIVVGQ
jgi:Ca-activated chloride channel family protein